MFSQQSRQNPWEIVIFVGMAIWSHRPFSPQTLLQEQQSFMAPFIVDCLRSIYPPDCVLRAVSSWYFQGRQSNQVKTFRRTGLIEKYTVVHSCSHKTLLRMALTQSERCDEFGVLC